MTTAIVAPAAAVPIVESGEGGRWREGGYPGAKNGSGVFQRLISQMPAHEVYVAGFAGHDALFFRKRPAGSAIVIDASESVSMWWLARASPTLTVLQDDFLVWVRTREGQAVTRDRATLLYLDPPYLFSTRCPQKKLYGVHDMGTEEDHAELLDLILPLRCMVMISGYDSPLYSRKLGHWRSINYPVMTRGGLKPEFCWMNFPAGLELHDCRYVGANFRERDKLKRKKLRLQKRIAAMSPEERQFMREALDEVDLSAISFDTAGG